MSADPSSLRDSLRPARQRSVVGSLLGLLAAFALICVSLACSGDDGPDRSCGRDGDCQLVNDCCHCEATNVNAELAVCNVACTTPACFDTFGNTSLVPRCSEGRCTIVQQ